MDDATPASADAKSPEVRLPVEVVPQNELTRKFTKKDWDAVNDLKVK